MGQLSEAKQIENITKAQEALAKEVGIKDNPWFCYPYGDKNEFTDAATKKAGIKNEYGHEIWLGTILVIIHIIFCVFGSVMR